LAQVRRRRGAVQVVLSPDEATTLGTLARQVSDLLTDDTETTSSDDPLEAMVGIAGGAVDTPDDPALKRLLPDAYSDDDAAAGEFRRLMDTELRQLKSSALVEVGDAMSASAETLTLRLAEEQAERWLQALTDIRLVLGTRLDVTEDPAEMLEQLGPDDQRLPLLAVYDWLGWLQESIVRALDS
jgi:hypothetical protein